MIGIDRQRGFVLLILGERRSRTADADERLGGESQCDPCRH